jgi:ABC-2 type transport system ATP-binding protein
LINAGKLIAEGDSKVLKTEYIKSPIFEIECDRVVDALQLMEKQDFVDETSIFGNQIHIIVNEQFKDEEQIKTVLTDQHINVKRLDRIVPTLEDVFIHLLDKDAAREK